MTFNALIQLPPYTYKLQIIHESVSPVLIHYYTSTRNYNFITSEDLGLYIYIYIKQFNGLHIMLHH